MMLLIPKNTPMGCIDYILDNFGTNYLSTQVKELMQLICSAGYSKVYKKIPQGKVIQNWIKSCHENEMFIMMYLEYIFYLDCLNIKADTKEKYIQIYQDFSDVVFNNWADSYDIKTAIFRYKKEYSKYTDIPTDTELNIKEANKEYRKYLIWKKQEFLKKGRKI